MTKLKCIPGVPGKSYKTRKGEKATIVFRVPEPFTNTGPLVGYVETPKGNTIYNWADDGDAAMGLIFNNPNDLVEEWAD